MILLCAGDDGSTVQDYEAALTDSRVAIEDLTKVRRRGAGHGHVSIGWSVAATSHCISPLASWPVGVVDEGTAERATRGCDI